MKIRKLNCRGIAHDVLVVAFVAVFAIAGVAYLVGSHADAPKATVASATGTIHVNAYYSVGCETVLVCLSPSNANVWVKGSIPSAKCDGLRADGFVNLEANRTISCTPGSYSLHLDNNKASVNEPTYTAMKAADAKCNGKHNCTVHNPPSVRALATGYVAVQQGKTVSVNLFTTER